MWRKQRMKLHRQKSQVTSSMRSTPTTPIVKGTSTRVNALSIADIKLASITLRGRVASGNRTTPEYNTIKLESPLFQEEEPKR